MKPVPLNMKAIIGEFESLGMHIAPGFLTHPLANTPILAQVTALLEAAAKAPVKLTAKGFLPMKLVERIAKIMPTASEMRFTAHAKRFIEQEQPAALRANALCDIGSLLRKSGGRLHLTAKGRGFLEATPNERYLFLLQRHLDFNLAYLDYAQASPLINALQTAVLQLMRDTDPFYRSAKVYVALLLDRYPQLFDEIEKTIQPNSYFIKEPVDEFETLFTMRLLRNFLVPFGLAQERGVKYSEDYEICKSPLCDALLVPVHAINSSVVLNKKRVSELRKMAREANLDALFFEDAVYALAACMHHPFLPAQMIAEQLVKLRRLIGTAARERGIFYEQLAASAIETVRAFTRLDAKGVRSDLQEEFEQVVEALLSLAPRELPQTLYSTLGTMPEHFFGWLATYYKIPPENEKIAEDILQKFDEEVLEDVGALIMSMGELHKAAIKAKRVNAKISTLAKESVIAFLLAVMSVHTFTLESE
ncbi:MAG: hypothetical protein IBX43_02025 [Campylobacterales bacterium]|nr:hypothetical protein [Campylobacterales bacterium]